MSLSPNNATDLYLNFHSIYLRLARTFPYDLENETDYQFVQLLKNFRMSVRILKPVVNTPHWDLLAKNVEEFYQEVLELKAKRPRRS